MLTGKLLGAGGTGAPAFELIAYSNQHDSSTSVTLPIAPQANDIIIVSIGKWAVEPPSSVPSIPAGYTRLARPNAVWDPTVSTCLDMGYKKATGSEGTTIGGFSVGGGQAGTTKFAAVYRAAKPYTTITARDVTSTTAQNFSTTVDANLSSLPTISVVGIQMASNTSTSTINRTMDYDFSRTDGPSVFRMAALAQGSSPLSVAWTSAASIVTAGVSSYLELS